MKINKNNVKENIDYLIKDLEILFKSKFQDSYVEFLKETNGGNIDLNYLIKIKIKNTCEIVTIKTFFGFTDREKDDLFIVNKRFLRLGCNILAFARSYEKGYFIFNIDDGKIYYWDIRLNMVDSTDDANGYFIANNFNEFIEIIDKNTKKREKGVFFMEKRDYLPLGSIVKLNGGIKKIMITSRGIIVNHNDEKFFFDYAGVVYPEGLTGDQVYYFNINNIANVIFKGFVDEDDSVIVDNINDYIKDNPDLIWGNIDNWD